MSKTSRKPSRQLSPSYAAKTQGGKKVLQILLDEKLREEAEEIAKADERSLSNWIVYLIVQAVKRRQEAALPA